MPTINAGGIASALTGTERFPAEVTPFDGSVKRFITAQLVKDFVVTGSLSPLTNDAAALGSATISWSDLFLASGGVINCANGDYTITHSTGTLTFSSAIGSAAKINVTSDGGGSQIIATNYFAGSSSPLVKISHARGSVATPADIVTSDQIYVEQGQGYGGGAFRTAYQFTVTTTEVTPSGTAMGARAIWSLAAIGSVSATEFMRIEHATGLSMFGANVVIDQNRIHRQRSYTIATLPSQVAGMTVYCSDLGGGGGILGSDGTNWKRLGEGGETTVATDAAFTLTPLTSAVNILHTGTLTANRVVTLSTTNAYAGARFRIDRTGSGAFTLDVGTGPLRSLEQNNWAEFTYDGAAWFCSSYGQPGVVVDNYTASGTWRKRAGAVRVEADYIGGGGGGGGGAQVASGSQCSGGGGGAGGFRKILKFLASDLGATEAVVIGAGGTAGVGATTVATAGGGGGLGGNTTFGSYGPAYGSGGGSGGQLAASSFGGGAGGAAAAGGNATTIAAGTAGNIGGATGNLDNTAFGGGGGGGNGGNAANGAGGRSCINGAAGGASGGGIGTGPTAFVGAASGRNAEWTSSAAGGAAGLPGGAGGVSKDVAGRGGASGGANTAGNGGDGGAGGSYGGGGGGAGSAIGGNGGNGGVGGDGYCRVTTFF